MSGGLRARRGARLAAGILAAAWTTTAIAAPPAGSSALHRPITVQDGFVLAVAGDTLGPRAPFLPAADPAVREVLALIESADAGFANQEGSVFEAGTFAGYPAAENGGGYPLTSTAIARDYRATGLNLMSRANNHALDWGVAGMLATRDALDAIGIVHAGSGTSAAEARAPAYLRTGKGAVALVATASSFTRMAPAADAAEGRSARPGISVIRTQPVTRVTPAEFRVLEGIARRGENTAFLAPADGEAREVSLGGHRYRTSPDALGPTYQADPRDRAAVLDAIAEAHRNADLTVFSIHAHQTASGQFDDPAPADFLRPLFHEAIEAGADIVVRHGPHTFLGIEIHQGRPIFHSAGSIFFNLAGSRYRNDRFSFDIPAAWSDTAVARVRVEGGRISEIRLYPAVLGPAEGVGVGLPRRARGADAERILEKIRRDSRLFGTSVEIEDGTAVVRLDPAP